MKVTKILPPKASKLVQNKGEDQYDEEDFETLVQPHEKPKIGIIPEYINQDRGMNILTKIVELDDAHAQISALINKAYERKSNWKQEEHEIKIDIIMDAQDFDTL